MWLPLQQPVFYYRVPRTPSLRPGANSYRIGYIYTYWVYGYAVLSGAPLPSLHRLKEARLNPFQALISGF